MMEQVDIYLKELLKSCESSSPGIVNMSERIKFLGTDIIGLLSFGYKFNLQTSEQNRFMIKSMKIGGYQAAAQLANPILGKLRVRDMLNVLFFKIRLGTFRVFEKMIRNRLSQQKNAVHDLYSFISDAIGSGSETIRESELWSEALFFLSAGKQ
jgi:cytochrome P450